MTKNITSYKSIKILEETHISLFDYAKLQGCSMSEVLNALVNFAVKNKIPFSRLTKNNLFDSGESELKNRIEYLISIFKNFENVTAVPTYQTTGRIEKEIDFILSNMQLNMTEPAEHILTEKEDIKQDSSIIDNINTFDKNFVLSLKKQKETAELRNTELIDALKDIFNKIGESSQGYKRTFEKDEYNYLKNLLDKCTQQ
jgi:uncharacterized protein (UPF0147 family)